MVRLNILVEGPSEETFVKEMLMGHLALRNVFVYVQCVETGRNKRLNKIYKGGLLDYLKAKKHLERWIKEQKNQSNTYFTTMFDLYALPINFPSFTAAKKSIDPYKRVESLESCFAKDVSYRNFIPYIQLHEFEALLLSEPSQFENYFIGQQSGIKELQTLVSVFKSPEEINEGKETAPSKRIEKFFPGYSDAKPVASRIIAQNIGLKTIRKKCPHFDHWLKKLEKLGNP